MKPSTKLATTVAIVVALMSVAYFFVGAPNQNAAQARNGTTTEAAAAAAGAHVSPTEPTLKVEPK